MNKALLNETTKTAYWLVRNNTHRNDSKALSYIKAQDK